MSSDSEIEDITPKGNVKLKTPIDINSCLKGQMFEIDPAKVFEKNEDYLPEEEISEFSKLVLDVDSDDDENDLTTTAFDELAKKMENVTQDGKIKKKIKRCGSGANPPEKSLISILYCSYLEFHDEPTDFAYMKKPLQFRLGTYGIIGLNIAVQSMKVGEKAQFLIHPDYAFGAVGHPPRIPPNATFFFQIELLKFSDSGPALEYDKLTENERKDFARVQKTAHALIEIAKEHMKHNVKLAIKDYNRAVNLLEMCNLKNIEEQETQQKMLLRLYTNLAICYNKDNQPKRACSMCNNIFNITKNTSLQIPAKVYYNNGRALSMIGEFAKAKSKLLQAQKIEPHNREISEELLRINKKWEEQKQKDKQLAKIYLESNNEEGKKPKDFADEYDGFRLNIRDMCNNLLQSNDVQYILPSGLTTKEYQIARSEAEKVGLIFRESKHNENYGKLTYYIRKM